MVKTSIECQLTIPSNKDWTWTVRSSVGLNKHDISVEQPFFSPVSASRQCEKPGIHIFSPYVWLIKPEMTKNMKNHFRIPGSLKFVSVLKYNYIITILVIPTVNIIKALPVLLWNNTISLHISGTAETASEVAPTVHWLVGITHALTVACLAVKSTCMSKRLARLRFYLFFIVETITVSHTLLPRFVTSEVCMEQHCIMYLLMQISLECFYYSCFFPDVL